MDTETTPEPAPWRCVKCGADCCVHRRNGGVRCIICGATYHLELDPQPAEVAEVERQEQAQLAGLTLEYPPAGGSLKAQPLLRPLVVERVGQSSAGALQLAVDDLTDTAARLGTQLEAGLGDAEATGKALAALYRQLGRVAGHAEALYGAGELGGWVLGGLVDPEGQV